MIKKLGVLVVLVVIVVGSALYYHKMQEIRDRDCRLIYDLVSERWYSTQLADNEIGVRLHIQNMIDTKVIDIKRFHTLHLRLFDEDGFLINTQVSYTDQAVGVLVKGLDMDRFGVEAP